MKSIREKLDELVHQLDGIGDCVVSKDRPLSDYTSYKIGGPAALFVAPQSHTMLKAVLEHIDRIEIPLFLLGHGSNVLVADEGWPGVVIHFGANLSGWRFNGNQAVAKSGTPLIDFIREAAARGLAGLEQLAGIPGSIGGALRMNAGAFGQEIQAVVNSVRGYRLNGGEINLTREEIDFNYRCAPQLDNLVITEGGFQFRWEKPAILKKRVTEILALRAQKQPLNYPSCGSVFKRPKGYYAAALIEGAGLKGVQVGDAVVSPKHSGFILNLGHATADDIYRLICLVEKRVWQRFGVRLEREVKLVGSFDR